MSETGATSTTPWSGHWWPYLQKPGDNLYGKGGPLEKYDQYVQNTRGFDPGAQAYEYQHFRTKDEKQNWWGHCQGLMAASMLTREPPPGAMKGGVAFTQDDLEGLVTALYSEPTFQWLAGLRATNNDQNSEAFKDINPAWMDYMLRYYVAGQKFPIAMDILTGSQVWNYPVFAYDRQSTPLADGSQSVKTTLWFADAAKGAEDTKYFAKTYTYQVWNTPEGKSDGRWLGDSVTDHPDFAWVPTGRGEIPNKKLDPAVVSEILGYQV